MLKVSCIILSEDYNSIQKETQSSKRKISILGGAVLVPVFIWFTIGFLFVKDFFHCSLFTSLVVGFLVSFLIYLIERSVVLSTNSNLLNTFRIALGIVVALLGSICLDEIIFKEDIRIMKEQLLVDQLQMESDIVKSLRNKIVALDIVISEKRDAAQAESQGKSSGSFGVGEITKLINNQIDDYITERKEVQSELNIELASISSDINAKIKNVQNGLSDSSLLYNIQTLYQLVKSDKTVAVIFSIVFLFFFFLEFLVVILKMTLPKSSYDMKIELQEKIIEHRSKLMRERIENHTNAYQYDPKYVELQKTMVGIF